MAGIRAFAGRVHTPAHFYTEAYDVSGRAQARP